MIEKKNKISIAKFKKVLISCIVSCFILSSALQINSFAAPKMLPRLNYDQSVVRVRNKKGVLSTAKVIHGKGAVQGATICLQVGVLPVIKYKNKVRKHGHWTINLSQGLSQNHKAGELLTDKPKVDVMIWQEKGNQTGLKSRVNVVLGTPKIVPSNLSTNGGLIAGQKTIQVKVPHDAVAVWVGLPEEGKDRRIFRRSSVDTYWQLGSRTDGFIAEAKTVDRDPFFHTVEITTTKSIVKEHAKKGFVATANQTKYSSISAFVPASNDAPTLTDADGDTTTLIDKEEISLEKIKSLVKASDKEDDAGATVGGTLSHKITKIDNQSVTDNISTEELKTKLSVGDHSITFIATDSQGKKSEELTVKVTISENIDKQNNQGNNSNTPPAETKQHKDLYPPTLKELTVLQHSVLTQDMILEKVELPKEAIDNKAIVSVIDTQKLSTKQAGEKQIQIRVFYGDASAYEGNVKVVVQAVSVSTNPITIKKGQELSDETVKNSVVINPEVVVTTKTVKEKVDTNKVGNQTAKVTVTYPNGDKEDVNVAVKVEENDVTLEKQEKPINPPVTKPEPKKENKPLTPKPITPEVTPITPSPKPITPETTPVQPKPEPKPEVKPEPKVITHNPNWQQDLRKHNEFINKTQPKTSLPNTGYVSNHSILLASALLTLVAYKLYKKED